MRKTLATLALTAVVLNTINFSVVEDTLGSLRFAPQAEAANAQNLGCNQPVLNGDPQNSQYINCWVQVNRPAGDTGATDMELGVHFENAFPGIASVANAGPEFSCTQDQPTPGNKRLDCKTTQSNSLALGQVKQIDFVLHVVGACGSHHEINGTVANVYGVNSALITAPIDFPACPAAAANVLSFSGTKTAANAVVAGQDLVYTITFTNNGTFQSNIRIADVVPPGLTFKPAGSSAGCALNGGTVFCPTVSMNPGQQYPVVLVFTVGANIPAGTIIDNAADVQQNNQSFAWTNHKQTTVVAAAPQFPVGTKTAVNTIQPGQDIAYTISFTNAGTTQQNIRIADVIPPGLTFKSAGSTGGCAVTGGVVYCPAQTVNAGAQISATLVFTVAANLPCGTIIDNAADLQQNNASFQWTNHKQTTAQCPGPVFPQGTKQGPATVIAGQDLTYTISFTNAGGTQQNIRIADVIPPGLTFKSAGSTAGCAVTAGVVFCPAQTVNAGASITATLVFTTAANIPAGTIIDNAADLQQNNASFQWTNHVQTTVQSAAPQFPQGTKQGPATVIAGQDL
ncbi:MAG TPA: hypothetical protein PKV72_00645, partial [Candidatus Peribacteria bacterium]|nr:hypothetical protein [Candidatus Peribacteria bacterium]